MFYIGDVHGRFGRYGKIIENLPCSIQLGDMGIGFRKSRDFPRLPPAHRFIRGNHDDPEKCRRTQGYIGDWGHLSEEGTFYVSGAYSVDKDRRIPGVSWWSEEELDWANFCKAIETYKLLEPDVVISHDCPSSVIGSFAQNRDKVARNATTGALDQMFEAHHPALWLFGHHHVSRKVQIAGTLFVCVGACLVYDSSKGKFLPLGFGLM